MIECGLQRARIDDGQRVTLVHLLASTKCDRLQLAVNLAVNRDCIRSLARVQAIKEDRHIARATALTVTGTRARVPHAQPVGCDATAQSLRFQLRTAMTMTRTNQRRPSANGREVTSTRDPLSTTIRAGVALITMIGSSGASSQAYDELK